MFEYLWTRYWWWALYPFGARARHFPENIYHTYYVSSAAVLIGSTNLAAALGKSFWGTLFSNYYVPNAVISAIYGRRYCARGVTRGAAKVFILRNCQTETGPGKWIGRGDGYNPINLTSPRRAMCRRGRRWRWTWYTRAAVSPGMKRYAVITRIARLAFIFKANCFQIRL